ncbi:Hsp20/alpha crystallin family protein [Halegenticoccus tardaugens]|uniref:Hsp20/alpha crystallin family protein n=1 Tax=Halegenticoccus tardaugens TaxID=2071624 RepID=UPI00100C16A0|nr:Hsp20/alpha crystallin family protein [Halegenticoccus tardaugens]
MSDRYNPFREIDELFERMNRGLGEAGLGSHDVSVDVSETDDAIVVAADLPGYDKEDIDVTIDDGRLRLRAERDRSGEAGDGRFLRRERTHRSVARTVYVPETVEEGEANATYRNGVLTVTLPKRDGSDAGRRIDVE